MIASIIYSPDDVWLENVPNSKLLQPIDVLVVVTRAYDCGSDLWTYHSYAEFGEIGNRMRRNLYHSKDRAKKIDASLAGNFHLFAGLYPADRST